MKTTFSIIKTCLMACVMLIAISGCQKLDRPGLGEFTADPPPPTLTLLGSQSYWPFNQTKLDVGEFKLPTTATSISYVPGVTDGDAAKIGSGGYLVSTQIPDGLKSPGSFSLSFWMNGVGPVQGGAQGLFAISNSKEFWGNFEVFLENLDNGDEAFIKVHMYNSNATNGTGEEWIEVKVPGALNKWTHIAMAYNATTSKITIYANGQPTTINEKVLGGGNYGGLAWKNVTGLTIGTFAFQPNPTLASHGAETWAKSFNGSLDQVRIFTKALTPTEVSNIFTNKL